MSVVYIRISAAPRFIKKLPRLSPQKMHVTEQKARDICKAEKNNRVNSSSAAKNGLAGMKGYTAFLQGCFLTHRLILLAMVSDRTSLNHHP
ncbi:MAG: hypothetical protein K2P63_09630 [Lachnospiraceae bacterium]|nr:hypothetical protein [Lachnospiraceae bacterium]